jgi:tripartite-type tricarboxylate transporter receptor subunit TctC
MTRSRLDAAGLIASGAMLLAVPAHADAIADFYKGKTVTIVAATGAGSAYGLHGRLLADALRRHMPGNPNIVMQFMPGGGGAKQANYMYNAAAKDGTWIGFPLKYIAVNQALGRKGLKYDAAKFGYVGSLGPINSAVVVMRKATPHQTFAALKSHEVIMGSTGKSSETYITPTLMNALLGTKFKVVSGYKGMKDITLAMERGEVAGRAGSWESLKSGDASWLKNDAVALVALSGLKRNWDLPKLPTLIELAGDPESKAILRFFGNGNAVGWLFATPPGAPADRLAALRKAFDATMADAKYKAAVKGRKLDLDPATGAEIDALVKDTLSVPPERMARIRKAMGM